MDLLHARSADVLRPEEVKPIRQIRPSMTWPWKDGELIDAEEGRQRRSRARRASMILEW